VNQIGRSGGRAEDQLGEGNLCLSGLSSRSPNGSNNDDGHRPYCKSRNHRSLLTRVKGYYFKAYDIGKRAELLYTKRQDERIEKS
jgi:hypothetical protein